MPGGMIDKLKKELEREAMEKIEPIRAELQEIRKLLEEQLKVLREIKKHLEGVSR